MFFVKSDPSITKFKISLRKEGVLSDIKHLSNNKDTKNQLFFCVNDKPEQEQKFDKIEQFLRGSIILEEVSGELLSLLDDVKKIDQNVKRSVDKISETNRAFTSNIIEIT